MNYNLRKQINFLFPIIKQYRGNRWDIGRKLSVYFIKNDGRNSKTKLMFSVERAFYPSRSVSSSNLAKANDSKTHGPNDDQTKNILNDDEFQNILSDFAKDFDVNSASEPILDEIRKSLDEPACDSKYSQNTDENSSSTRIKIDNKFKDFSESDAAVIPSSEELQNEEYIYHIDQDYTYQHYPADLKRGITGVFDIDELYEALQKEKLENITTISIPADLHYTDYLVIATAKSLRHSNAVCERIIKLYKLKKNSKDPFVIVEGEKLADWKAIDMGNIVLHIFLEKTRVLYDIESLWLFDSKFDRGGNQKHDPLYDEIEEQMAFFNALNESGTQEPTKKP